MQLAFAGTAPFGADVLRGLLEHHDVQLVISQPDRPAGRGRKLVAPPVAQLAHERGIPLIQPEKMTDPEVLPELERLGIDTIVVAAFGQMIREPILSRFLLINAHGSILPLYRGAAPIERAIMDGHSETGVCAMRVEAGLDTGAVAACERFPIEVDDDAGAVFAKAGEAGTRAILEALARAEAGSLEWVEQDDAAATHAAKIAAADRLLDFTAGPRAVHDHVRALSPHIGAICSYGGERMTLWKTRLMESAGSAPIDNGAPGTLVVDGGRLFVRCGDAHEMLEVLELQAPGKKRMQVGDWLRGLREAPDRFEPLALPTA